MKVIQLENQRQNIQFDLDNLKTKEERNKLGQFSTPIVLANDILKYTSTLISKKEKIRFLDPAIGTGVFFSALSKIFSSNEIETARGFEIDKHYGIPSKSLWSETKLTYEINDFTLIEAPKDNKDKYNLLICNPPYSRHHHIKEQKQRLKLAAKKSANINLSGLAGLYCYFIALSNSWMKDDAIGVWLLPSEFMDVNYGNVIKEYLLNKVCLLRVHRFDPTNVQFEDALVSSSVAWFQNTKPSGNNEVLFSYGGTIDTPTCEKMIKSNVLKIEKKWTRFPLMDERIKTKEPKLNDFFSIKRGIATGDNSFFILSKEDIKKKRLPIEQFTPILPSPRYLKNIEILTDKKGNPKIEKQLYVLNCILPISEIQSEYPTLYKYLQEGIQNGVVDRYLCKNRKVWYIQEKRKESLFYCTYMGRSSSNKKAFRFILNNSKAIVSNSYLILYIKPELEYLINIDPEIKYKIIEALNKVTNISMIEEGRVYGGGLHKLEPKELGNVAVPEIVSLLAQASNKALQQTA